jgi:hypothetical protein
MTNGQSTTRPEPDSAPFKVHLLTRAGRIMRARSEPVRAFSNKDEAVRFAGRQLGGATRCTTSTGKFGLPGNHREAAHPVTVRHAVESHTCDARHRSPTIL